MRSYIKPKIIFTDFDGCLTDDRVWLNEHGEEFVAANRKDGLAVERLNEIDVKVIIISSEKNKVVLARGKKLKVEVLQGVTQKDLEIDKYLIEANLLWADIWYVGNDLNDLKPILKAAVSLCPADAVGKIKKAVDIKLKTKGGFGVLSEIATMLEKIN
jgi:N-acylneuraminate cytidylyltransferase